MIIDIRDEVPDLFEYVRTRVASHKQASLAKNLPPVGMITFGFEFGQSNWVALAFDTREEAEPDGTWSAEIEKFLLKRPHWPIWPDLPDDVEVEFINLEGEQINVMDDPDELICEIIGETLKHVLESARNQGMFVELPQTETCELYVENLEGYYAWPEYEDRKQVNLARMLDNDAM